MAKREPHPAPPLNTAPKRPFDIDLAMARIAAAVAPFPKAALFELAERGHTSAFEQLVACIISIRTRDEVMLPTVLRLFAAAPTPATALQLGVEQIDLLIATCPFHQGKALQIHAIAQRTVEEFGGTLPCDEQVLLSLHGVGPKCANLVLGIVGGQPFIGVDIHVHRIVTRWKVVTWEPINTASATSKRVSKPPEGVSPKTPEQTMAVLEGCIPVKYWVDLNRLLVPFGKHICTGNRPKCSTCPILDMCPQYGVTDHR